MDDIIEDGYFTSEFSLTVDGVEIGRFHQVDGLSFNVAPIPAVGKTEDGESFNYKVPGRTMFSPITLRRPLSDSNTLLEWLEKTVDEGDVERKTGEIVMYNRAGTRRGAWAFEGAFISHWSISPVSTSADEVLDEVVTLSVDRFYRADA